MGEQTSSYRRTDPNNGLNGLFSSEQRTSINVGLGFSPNFTSRLNGSINSIAGFSNLFNILSILNFSNTNESISIRPMSQSNRPNTEDLGPAFYDPNDNNIYVDQDLIDEGFYGYTAIVEAADGSTSIEARPLSLERFLVHEVIHSFARNILSTNSSVVIIESAGRNITIPASTYHEVVATALTNVIMQRAFGEEYRVGHWTVTHASSTNPRISQEVYDQLIAGGLNVSGLTVASITQGFDPNGDLTFTQTSTDALFEGGDREFLSPRNLEAAVGDAFSQLGDINNTPALQALIVAMFQDADIQGFDLERDANGVYQLIATEVVNSIEYTIKFNERYELYGVLGSTIGSSIGSLLAEKLELDGVAGHAADIVSSAVFGQIGSAFGQALAGNAYGENSDFLDRLNGEVGSELFADGALRNAIQGAAIGTVSSLLTSELADTIGLDGLAGEVFGVVGSSVLNALGTTVAGNLFSTTATSIFQSVGDAIAGADVFDFSSGSVNPLASFLGSKLGSLVISPTTQAGAVLSSLGSSIGAIGSFAAASALGIKAAGIGNAIVPVVGAFVGFVLGALIGNLFGKKKPKIPTADASTVLNFQDGYYQLGTVHSANNGNEDLVTDMANAAADTLNAFIDVVSAGDPNARNINTTSPTQIYGHTGNQLYVTLGGVKQNVSSADEAVDAGALYAIEKTKIAGGSLFMKRAVLASTADNLASFGGDLKVAEDYTTYKLNQVTIDAAIAAPYESLSQSDKNFYNANEARFLAVQRRDHAALTGSNLSWYNGNKARVDAITTSLNSVSQFAAGWIITLQRAAELGLNQSAESDFYGGAQGFVESLKGVVSAPLDYEDVTFYLRGNDLEVYRDDDGNGSPHSAYDTLIFDETNFLRPIGSDGGGVGYNRATSNANLTTGNDIITNAAGTIDDLTTQTTSVWVPPEYIPEFGITIPGYWQETTGTFEGGDDIITGNSAANTFRGRSGNDWLDGGAAR